VFYTPETFSGTHFNYGLSQIEGYGVAGRIRYPEEIE
jgi:hypothetical protein